MKNTIGTWPTMPLECVDDHVSDPVGEKSMLKTNLGLLYLLVKWLIKQIMIWANITSFPIENERLSKTTHFQMHIKLSSYNYCKHLSLMTIPGDIFYGSR